MTKQSKKNERNQKFIEFYNEISETEAFLGLKTHKRVKYLAEEFKERNKIDIPIGTMFFDLGYFWLNFSIPFLIKPNFVTKNPSAAPPTPA